MRITTSIVASLAVVGSLFGGVAGCGSGGGESPLSKTQQQKQTKLADVVKRTGGDWEKATAQDRAFLVEMSRGNEDSARKLLAVSAGRPPISGATGKPMAPR